MRCASTGYVDDRAGGRSLDVDERVKRAAAFMAIPGPVAFARSDGEPFAVVTHDALAETVVRSAEPLDGLPDEASCVLLLVGELLLEVGEAGELDVVGDAEVDLDAVAPVVLGWRRRLGASGRRRCMRRGRRSRPSRSG
jgi:hypothetical protein